MTEGLFLSPLGHLPVDLAKSQAGEEAEGSGGKSAKVTRTLGRPRSAQEALEFSTWVYSVEPGVEGAAARASGPAGAGGLPRGLHAGGCVWPPFWYGGQVGYLLTGAQVEELSQHHLSWSSHQPWEVEALIPSYHEETEGPGEQVIRPNPLVGGGRARIRVQAS